MADRVGWHGRERGSLFRSAGAGENAPKRLLALAFTRTGGDFALDNVHAHLRKMATTHDLELAGRVGREGNSLARIAYDNGV